MPRPGSSLDADRGGETDPPVLRATHQALGEDVRRELVERRGEAERLLGRERAQLHDRLDLGVAARHGAGLVEQHGRRRAEALEDAGAFHDDPSTCRAREAADERDRRSAPSAIVTGARP